MNTQFFKKLNPNKHKLYWYMKHIHRDIELQKLSKLDEASSRERQIFMYGFIRMLVVCLTFLNQVERVS